MADIVIYVPSGTTVETVEGAPPVDQSALVAQLQSQVTQLTSDLNAATTLNGTLQGKIDAARAAAQSAVDRDAAVAEGQAVLDALA